MMNQVFLILLGWLLGTLSPGIVEAIRRRKRQKEVLRALRTELADLRYKAALVAHQVRAKTGSMTVESLGESKRLIMDDTLPGDDGRAAAALRTLLEKVGDASYVALQNERGMQNPGYWPVPYEAPFLDATLVEISLFAPNTQLAICRVRSELHLFNHQVGFIKSLSDRTFGLTGENYQINQGNLDTATRNLIVRAECLIDSIDALIEREARSA